MQKNIYKKFMSQLNKSDTLAIERAGDTYYLTNGYIGLQISDGEYEYYFHNNDKKGDYPILSDSESTINGEQGRPGSLARLFDNARNKCNKAAYITDIIREQERRNVRIIQSEDALIYVNNEYYLPFRFINEWKTGGPRSPLVGEYGNSMAIILPLISPFPSLKLKTVEDLTGVKVETYYAR